MKTDDGVRIEIRCWSWTSPMARKEHLCDWDECPRPGAIIPEGETYLRSGGSTGWAFHVNCGWSWICSQPVQEQAHFISDCGPGCIVVSPYQC